MSLGAGRPAGDQLRRTDRRTDQRSGDNDVDILSLLEEEGHLSVEECLV
jgi:hypothetical protein